VTDCVLLSASHRNIETCIEIAVQHPGIGIELMTFAFPDLLDGNWQAQIPLYRDLLEPVRAHGGRVTLHGPFMDLPAGSPDAQISRIVADRHRHAIQIAAQVGAEIVILHANYIGQTGAAGISAIWRSGNRSPTRPPPAA
jgi:sugar phosphate isomerase/epimerase